MGARKPSTHLRCDALLVRGIAEGEQEADRDRLDVAEIGHRREVEWSDDAVRSDPLLDAEAAIDRHERLAVLGVEPIQMRSRLSSQVQEMLEAGCREERRPCSPALKQGVRRDRRPVGEARDVVGTDRTHGGDHALGLRAGSSRHLARGNAVAIEPDGVRKRSADIDT